jgi:hypothetical protein
MEGEKGRNMVKWKTSKMVKYKEENGKMGTSEEEI